jgi:soluble cytochrome b562
MQSWSFAFSPTKARAFAEQSLYSYILDKKKKAKDIKECSQYNLGFQKFIEQLDKTKGDIKQLII